MASSVGRQNFNQSIRVAKFNYYCSKLDRSLQHSCVYAYFYRKISRYNKNGKYCEHFKKRGFYKNMGKM